MGHRNACISYICGLFYGVYMSRAKDPHERDLLRGARNSNKSSLDGKACGNVSCQELGRIQPIENFYSRNGKPGSYCILCRRAASEMWRISNPDYKRSAVKKKQVWNLNLGKAPWCKDHKKNSAKCGCAMGIHHKSPAHRRKISAAMKGNTNAAGKQGKRGPMSAAHKAKISMAMRGQKGS